MSARILLLVPLIGCCTGTQDKCPLHCWGFTQLTENSWTFHDEGVWLEMVTLAGVGNGAQITGNGASWSALDYSISLAP